MKDKPSTFEWLILFVFVALGIVLFWLRIVTPPTELNQLDNVLYSSFEVIFSLYIGYFLQRLDSIRQFQESLKRYGLSAYRRIMDIRKSVDRSIAQIDKMNKSYPKDKTNDIDVLRQILEGTFDTVESSVADWGDIIGEEIKKKEKADRLQETLFRNESRSNLSEDAKRNIEDIRNELSKLKSEIPSVLQNNYLSKAVEEEKVRFYHSHLLSSFQRDGYVEISARIVLGLPLSPEEKQEIVEKQPFFLKVSGDINNAIIDVYNKRKQKIGSLINLINDDDRKYLFYALYNIFDFSLIEGDDGFIRPKRCEFGKFHDNESKFTLLISSDLFPRG